MTTLLHIGYHKTATTWLQRNLFRHPDVGLYAIRKSSLNAPVREIVRARPLEFDPASSRARFEPVLDGVRAEGFVPVVSWERLSGHPSSGGYDSKEIADRLAVVFPGSKVLVVLREQQSVIASVYKQYVLAGGPARFEEFVTPPIDPGYRIPAFDFGFYEYHHLLGYYRERFGPESVLVLAYEQFVGDPAAFVRSICEFAGRPLADGVVETLPFAKRLKRTPSASAIALTRWSNRLLRRSQYNPVPLVDAPRVADRVRKFARGPALEALPAGMLVRGNASLERSVALAVGDRYRESNRITAELTGLDLAGLGWAA